ncbi:hypothetical protein [Embleya sp. NPDC020630]|uniref:hypothetical protein n=1 Tax=Embleya sp. NPDC020630 TaxID=3363979 RepID=UPI00378D0129
MNDEHYAALTIIDCCPDTAAELGDRLRDAGFLTDAERYRTDPDAQEQPPAPGEVLTAYGIDTDGIQDVLDELAALDPRFACRVRTEGERGEPGTLFVHLPGRTWRGPCDRAATPVVDADTAAAIAAEPDHHTRARLLDAATGHRIRAALAHLQHLHDLEAIATEVGIAESDLDAAVHDVFAEQAAEVNNGGRPAQLVLLNEGCRDRDAFRDLLRDLRS